MKTPLSPDALPIRFVFQPIREIGTPDAPAMGFEGLARGPVGTRIESASSLLGLARANGVEDVVQLKCLQQVLRAARELPSDALATVNVGAGTLCRQPGFASRLDAFLCEAGFLARRLVLEVSGFSSSSRATLLARVAAVREVGVSVALDDSGLGEADLPLLLQVRPSFLKLGRTLVDGVSCDPSRRSIVDGFVHLAGRLGFELVAKCVETSPDLDALRSAGVRFAQGWRTGRPAPASRWAEERRAETENVWGLTHAV
jgi:EAL domain-containing protein (putative c-di-GMP-specific phosphodiesterase class I)